MTQNRRLEDDIVLRCVKGDVNGSDRSESGSKEIDWEYLLNTADEHGVLPQLENYVDRHFDPPTSVRSALQTQTRQNALHSLRLTDELRDILALFGTIGIDAIPFKGPALSASVYDGVADRQFVDLDILVREEVALEAKQLLVEEGYEHTFDVQESQESAFVRTRHVFELWLPDKAVKVELHWRLTPRNVPFSFDYDRLWSDRRTQQLADRDVSVLSPEDRLLYLCVHGSWHGWSTLKWMNDVAAVVQTESIDWQQVCTRAQKRGGERMLLLGLSLAQRFFETRLPADIASATTEPPIPALTAEVETALFEGALDRNSGSEIIDFRRRVCERRVDRLSYPVRLATMPMPADFERWRLPGSVASLYHVLRPVSYLARTVSPLEKANQ